MDQNVFHIKKLLCSYDGTEEHAVLYIEDLEIKRGEIVFLLGSSGSGKSTLLEILGLMNDPIASGEVWFYPPGQQPVDLVALWQKDDIKTAAQIRKSNFSFIFQNTNLMENFTAYENVTLSRMIQSDVSQQEAMSGAEGLMKKVGLPLSQVPYERLSVNLSGGQRQRVTFVRALNSNCTVLFGDEPTGNLDEGNANELMNVVKSYLTEKNLTAIIVSHDINLALNHASRIICLTPDPVTGVGKILQENNFARSLWESYDADQLQAFRQAVRSFYTIKKPQPANTKTSGKEVKLSKGYRPLFLAKEGRALSGKGYSNMVILVMLLLCTFLAIGFANGSLAYLKQKIENPFVNWLTIDIPYAKNNPSDIAHIINGIESKKDKYSIRSVSTFMEGPMKFYLADLSKYVPTRARSARDTRDPLIATLVDKSNCYLGKKSFLNDKDMSVIVTRRFMAEHGYAEDAPFVYREDNETDDSTRKRIEFKVPIGVRAVVKEMPGKAQVVYTDYFNKADQYNAFDLRRKQDFILYVATTREEAQKLRVSIQQYLKTSPWGHGHIFDIQLPSQSDATYYSGFDIDITPSPPLAADQWGALYKDISSQIPARIHSGYYFNYDDFSENVALPISSDKISVNFINLNQVRAFHDYCLSTFNEEDERDSNSQIEPDLANVKEKENFNFLSHITKAVSWILILFGTISVSLFVFNLLKMHLSKVTMNIGTFKAFGLSDSEAQRIYFFIIIRFLVLSILLSLFIAAGMGYFLNKILIDTLALETGANYFNLLYLYTYITLGLILVSALTVSWFTIRAMLSKTPGDLIYNR